MAEIAFIVDLSRLPPHAIAAYAARCAMRVQPLFLRAGDRRNLPRVWSGPSAQPGELPPDTSCRSKIRQRPRGPKPRQPPRPAFPPPAMPLVPLPTPLTPRVQPIRPPTPPKRSGEMPLERLTRPPWRRWIRRQLRMPRITLTTRPRRITNGWCCTTAAHLQGACHCTAAKTGRWGRCGRKASPAGCDAARC